ncbi:MAG: hypothetical protein GTO40_08760 [Deltaproteobacteria bacterium]|nr:hypothetical protein [Deltaproteobacteria bacterium]
MADTEVIRRAYNRAFLKLVLYVHLIVYIVVNLLLVYVNYTTSPQYLWFKWPLLGWGFGLFAHAYVVFAGHRILMYLVKRELEADGHGRKRTSI